jgi:hypothetical protein
MSRFFHTLVVVGAGISAAACGGKSQSRDGDENAAGSGGTGAAGRAGNGATGGAETGGGAGTGGMGTTGPFPEPQVPTSQWDCFNSFMGCVDALGVTAHRLTGSCPVDETRPTSAADCATDEIYSCMLAVSVSGEPLLVNCDCWPAEFACDSCISLDSRNGAPVSCTPTLKICECAYTGILK